MKTKRIAILLILLVISSVIIATRTQFVRDSIVRDSLAKPDALKIVQITARQLTNGEWQTGIRCEGDLNLWRVTRVSIGTRFGISPLPGPAFVIHVFTLEKPNLLSTIKVDFEHIQSNGASTLTTRFWPNK